VASKVTLNLQTKAKKQIKISKPQKQNKN